jgi:hypothetical protein
MHETDGLPPPERRKAILTMAIAIALGQPGEDQPVRST